MCKFSYLTGVVLLLVLLASQAAAQSAPLLPHVPRRALRAEPTAPKPTVASAAASAAAAAKPAAAKPAVANAKPAATDKAAAAAKPAAPAKPNPEAIGAALAALANAPPGAPPDEAKLATFGIKRIESPEAELQELLIGPDSGYDRMSFPWAEFGPANVSMNMAFHSVIDVNLYAGSMKVSTWFSLYWNDPRLRWDATKTGVHYLFANHADASQADIWYPDVTLWNAAADPAASTGVRRLRISPNGNVEWSRDAVFEVSCNFVGLESFPYGRIGCELEMGTWVDPANRVNLTLEGDGAELGGSQTDSMHAEYIEYNIESVDALRYNYGKCAFPPCLSDESAEWPVVFYQVVLKRASVLYTFKILLPQIILTMVGFSTFWLSPECGERLGLAITVPLAVAVYDLLVFSSLPTSNKINFVSAMGLMAFLFSIAVLVENAIALQLYYYREPSYFRSVTSLGVTMVSYRQQTAWVRLLKVFHELKVYLARHQLALAAKDQDIRQRLRSERSRANLRSFKTLDSSGGPGGATTADTALTSPCTVAESAAGNEANERNTAAKAGPEAGERTQTRFGSDALAVAHASARRSSGAGAGTDMASLDHMLSLSGAGGAAAAPPEHASELDSLLSAGGAAGLQARLQELLEDPDPRLDRLQARISRASLALGGLERLARRLHATLGGGDTGGGEDQEEGSLAEFKERLGDAYNLRWRLLSSAIDHLCRWVFVVAYVCSVLTTAIVLSAKQGALFPEHVQTTTA